MDFMKLFGTVIAVLFHPGSASRLNGERDKNPNSAATALRRLDPPFKHQYMCFIDLPCPADRALMDFTLYSRALGPTFFFFF